MEDEHLAVGRRRRRRSRSPGSSSCGISASVIAAGTASKTIAKQPAACSASASSAICAAWPAVLPWALKPPSAVAVCGVRPTWPITGIPARTIARARSTEEPPRSSLTASQPASLTNRCAFAIACSFELLVGAERHVADEQRRPQPAPDGRRQHQHLVHARPATVACSRARSSRRCRRRGRCRRRPPRRPGPRGSRRRSPSRSARALSFISASAGRRHRRALGVAPAALAADARCSIGICPPHRRSVASIPITLSISRARPTRAATATSTGRPLKLSRRRQVSASRASRYSGSIPAASSSAAGRRERRGGRGLAAGDAPRRPAARGSAPAARSRSSALR